MEHQLSPAAFTEYPPMEEVMRTLPHFPQMFRGLAPGRFPITTKRQ